MNQKWYILTCKDFAGLLLRSSYISTSKAGMATMAFMLAFYYVSRLSLRNPPRCKVASAMPGRNLQTVFLVQNLGRKYVSNDDSPEIYATSARLNKLVLQRMLAFVSPVQRRQSSLP